jgi:hypothetical protein
VVSVETRMADPAPSNPYEAPKNAALSGVATMSTDRSMRKRGGCLGAMLVLMMIANPLVALIYVATREKLTEALHAPDWAVPTLAVVALVNFAAAIGAWRFKKWGIYGACAVGVIALAINVSIGLAGAQIVMGLLGPILLVVLATRQWQDFD